MSRVILAMSGGIDSSVSAYLLKEEGYEVEGVSFLMWGEGTACSRASCCSFGAVAEARQTARSMGISHSEVDVRKDFAEKVIMPFVNAYLSGLTPNPCVLCNRFIKFPHLVREAERRDAEYIATGHYARVERIQNSLLGESPGATKFKIPAASPKLSGPGRQNSEENGFLLRKGIDLKKDQSYVLYALEQEELARLILPVGCLTKSDVRKTAEKLGLAAVRRRESQEICFVENRNYLEFIEGLSSIRGEPGPVADLDGRVIGKHVGIQGYTVGQRKGLGISSSAPLYVVDIDLGSNTVYVGPRESARKRDFLVGNLNWIIAPAGMEFRASVKVRSTMKEQPATVTISGDAPVDSSSVFHPSPFTEVRVVFDEPQWAPAPGQSAVFYAGDTVIGGGVIKKPA